MLLMLQQVVPPPSQQGYFKRFTASGGDIDSNSLMKVPTHDDASANDAADVSVWTSGSNSDFDCWASRVRND